jgi:hypothetical protein
MNPGIIHFPAASYVVVADKPEGGEPVPIAVMVSSFPTTMYPVKGFSCPGTMVKRSAFVMSSFASGACVWARLTPAPDNERITTKRAFVRIFILNRNFLFALLKTAPCYIRLAHSRY